ncbi:MAG: GGDEF domain-containing protein, partial [Bdellovibrionota bacterium]
FLIVLTEINPEGALVFAERLKKLIEGWRFKNDQHEKRLTASIGLAITPPGSKDVDARSIVRAADRALYKAKESGRNRVENTMYVAPLEALPPADPIELRRNKGSK